MLYLDRIDVSEGINVNKTSEEHDIYHHWYFLNFSYKFQANVCNGCHDWLLTSTNLIASAISDIKVDNYCCIISGISKSEVIDLMQNIDLTKKSRTL